VSEDVEHIGLEYSDEVSVKDVISIDYLPKNKSPINNLFLVAPLFTPCSRNLKTSERYREVVIKDQFGYSIEIRGPRLNMSIDFPIWSHIIKLVIENKTNRIVMSYMDFAKIMGYDRKNLGKKLQERIKESLIRLRSQVIIGEDFLGDEEDEIAGLLDNGTIKKKTKEVVLTVNKSIIELYKRDRFKLIDLEYYNGLDNEITKALYLYYENHKSIVYPIKIENVIDRLNLVTKNSKEINRQIKAGHENLVANEYLSKYEYLKINKEKYVKVYK
jgi:hypothetical protein